MKFKHLDKSIAHIEPDVGDDTGKWSRGAMADSGVIYCSPLDGNRGILKIDTNTDNVPELDRNLLTSCALAVDGCIYFMPFNALRFMKLNPNNNDAISSAGDDLGNGVFKYTGTVVGIDGCGYGIPCYSKRVIKYDDIISFVGEEDDEYFMCGGNGVLGRDGCIYTLVGGDQALKIDTTNNSHCFVGNTVESDHADSNEKGDGILGIDG